MISPQTLFDTLNRDYMGVHKAKEDLFWSTYMATSDDSAGFAAAEAAYKNFISDPAKLAAVRAALAELPPAAATEPPETAALRHGLKGWLALFESNIIDSEEARRLMGELIDMEAALFAQRRNCVLRHTNEAGVVEDATLGSLSVNMATNPDEAARKSSHDAYLSLEEWVLAHGFLEIVKKRNAFARAQGFPDYFDYKVRKNEQMTSAQLFGILDDFEARTASADAAGRAALTARHGARATLAWNMRFHSNGDVTRQLDAYLPFGKALARWVDSFGRLGIGFRGATLQLDLL